MRIHFGISKFIKPSTLIKVLGTLFVGALAFLGLTQHAYAEALSVNPTSASYVNDLTSTTYNPTISVVNGVGYGSLGAYYFDISNPGANSYNFTYNYSTQSICSSTNGIASGSFQYSLDNANGSISSTNVSVQYIGGGGINTTKNGNVITFNRIDFNRPFKVVINTGDGSQATRLYIDKGWNLTCVNADPNQSIIDADNQNTQDIIDNQNQNTQDIIDNQNSNTQAIIDSNKVCTKTLVRIDSTTKDNFSVGYINYNGTIGDNSLFRYTDYISISSGTSYVLQTNITNVATYYCLYNSNKVIISCSPESSTSIDIIPSENGYLRFTGRIDNNSYFTLFDGTTCINGNQAIVDSNNQLNDSLTDSSSPDNSEIVTVFGVTLQDHGLTSVAIAPIRLLSSLLDSNSSCNDLTFDITLGSLTKSVTLPSGCILWGSAPATIVGLYQTFIFGLLGFYVLLDMYKFLSNLLDPENKDIYFLDL